MARVLVVDDEADVLQAVEIVLRTEGHEVTAESDSQQALRKALNENFDVAILDLMMPVVTGEELLRQIKKRRPELPVILLSGTSDLFDVDKLLAMGVCAYFDKPFEPAALLEAVRQAVRS